MEAGLEAALVWEQAFWLTPRHPTFQSFTLVFSSEVFSCYGHLKSDRNQTLPERLVKVASGKHGVWRCFVKPQRDESFQRQVKFTPWSRIFIFIRKAKLNVLTIFLIACTFLTSVHTSSHCQPWSFWGNSSAKHKTLSIGACVHNGVTVCTFWRHSSA